MGKCEQCGGNEVIIIDPDQPVPCWCVMRMLQDPSWTAAAVADLKRRGFRALHLEIAKKLLS